MTTLINCILNFKREFIIIYLDKSVPIPDPGSLVSFRLCVPSLPLTVPSSPETSRTTRRTSLKRSSIVSVWNASILRATMPPISKDSKKDHHQNRQKTCALCLNEKGFKASVPISGKVARIISEKVDGDFSLSDPRFGAALCVKCDINIHLLEKHSVESVYISARFGEDIPLQLRSDHHCKCIICARATLNGPEWMRFRKKWINKKPGRPSTKNPASSQTGDRRRCSKCFTEVRNISSVYQVYFKCISSE